MKSLCINNIYMSLNVSLRQIPSGTVTLTNFRCILLNFFSEKFGKFAFLAVLCVGGPSYHHTLWSCLSFTNQSMDQLGFFKKTIIGNIVLVLSVSQVTLSVGYPQWSHLLAFRTKLPFKWTAFSWSVKLDLYSWKITNG